MSVAISNLATTWTNSGTTYTGIKLNVTDTASAAASLLMDLQVGGTSKFKVGKDGYITTGDYVFDSSYGLRRTSAAVTTITGGLTGSQQVDINGLFLLTNAITLDRANQDVKILRDAAQTLAQRNGTNAQIFRVYNTYTDASNYERGFLRWSGNTFEIGTEKAGTGSNRQTWIYGGGGAGLIITGSSVNFYQTPRGSSDGNVDLGVPTARWANLYLNQFVETEEMTAPAAPAANKVRIYAEDDGAGKTRLMARFATGAAVQIAIEP